MSEYLNPPDQVARVAQPIDPTFGRVPDGSVLVGVYDKGLYRIALVLTPEDRAQHDAAYDRGIYLSRAYYAVPIETAREMGAQL